jgi:hypothetical protein
MNVERVEDENYFDRYADFGIVAEPTSIYLILFQSRGFVVRDAGIFRLQSVGLELTTAEQSRKRDLESLRHQLHV